MNRTLIFGIALFFALVGLALVGPERTAVAGHGAGSCKGDNARKCGGRRCDGKKARRSHSRRTRCCGCSGKGSKAAAAAPADAPAPPPAAPAPPQA